MATAVKCPFCFWLLRDDDATHTCEHCSVVAHEECWNENGGCTTFGCPSWATSQGVPPPVTAPPPPAPAPAPIEPQAAPPPAPTTGAVLPGVPSAPPAAFCDQCGTPVTAGDRFCATCGNTL